jgi:hypothetical protein
MAKPRSHQPAGRRRWLWVLAAAALVILLGIAIVLASSGFVDGFRDGFNNSTR